MLEVTEAEIAHRLAFDNPWWDGEGIVPEVDAWPRRSYFEPFMRLVHQEARRAVVLMGPRRIGKTVLIQHAIKALLDEGVPAGNILYASIDNPLYTGIGLEKFLHLFQGMQGHPKRPQGLYVFFDEVQYLKDWERHLKTLVDSYPGVRFVVSGSAAAALRLKSQESGAGRFSEFSLPPLTFAEFLSFRTVPDDIPIDRLNEEFLDYIAFGGFPEAVMTPAIRQNFRQFVGNDIVDKVLLRDLPSLYGIQDTQELNRLFATLAYNTGQEVSLDGLAKSSGVAKNTLKRYLDYLEAAFLIRRVHRVDQTGKRFQRVTRFKVYLTNPSLRSALFGMPHEGDPIIGALVETAIFAQRFPIMRANDLAYARWPQGELDMVVYPDDPEGLEAVEIKWSDRQESRTVVSAAEFAKNLGLDEVTITTKSVSLFREYDGVDVNLMPAATLARRASMIGNSVYGLLVDFQLSQSEEGGPEGP